MEIQSAAPRLPVVYLDQNQWITIAQAKYSPQKVKNVVELGAADSVVRSATDGKVLLPLSTAHLVETARTGNPERRGKLADSMLELYDGWHMRHPLDIRQFELMSLLRGETAPRSIELEPFSTKPNTPFQAAQWGNAFQASDDFTAAQQKFITDRAWRAAWSETLRHDTYDADERRTSDQFVEGWAKGFEELGRYMGNNPAPRDVRLVAAGKLMADLNKEIALASAKTGITPEDLAPFLRPENLVDSFAKLPFIGRLLDVTFQRLRNPQTRWKRNDLNDMTYLCCAAAYADFVVAERATAHFLRLGTGNFPSGALVLRDLSELRPLLP
ncbi:hypothetical protein [Pseudonocardia sp. NPDC046786]|uniref:hypothetical protein n=1 Tax=Pseudonocardia sp. NPDC046786 TaxID=3155471 RepID=UPI0033C23CD1